MSDFLKNFLIELVIGFLAAIAICLFRDILNVETVMELFRVLSDGFFAAAALFLAIGGITFTTNGGVFDGLGFTARTMIDRIRGDYEKRRISFADYRDEQRKKAKSPAVSLLVGLVLLIIAFVFTIVFYTA